MTRKIEDQNQGPAMLQRFCETNPSSAFADHMSFCAYVGPESLVALTGRRDDARHQRPKPATDRVSAFLPNEATATSEDPILPNEATATSEARFCRTKPPRSPKTVFAKTNPIAKMAADTKLSCPQRVMTDDPRSGVLKTNPAEMPEDGGCVVFGPSMMLETSVRLARKPSQDKPSKPHNRAKPSVPQSGNVPSCRQIRLV